ncbi:hypothetical protein QQF64_002586 [Cirrhinus molitorella]|uniref:DUF4939 domain-containing protein n=1 Tax=Cirrhinus molitorella TaxID=172907 RepID=A0ABR3MQL2_9TELE
MSPAGSAPGFLISRLAVPASAVCSSEGFSVAQLPIASLRYSAFLNFVWFLFSFTENSRVAFVLTLLTGKAALWGTAVWENQHPCCSSFQALSTEMKAVFDHAVAGR